MALNDKIKGLKRRIPQVNQAIQQKQFLVQLMYSTKTISCSIDVHNKNNVVCEKCIKTIGNKESQATTFQLSHACKNVALKIPIQQLLNTSNQESAVSKNKYQIFLFH